MHRVVASHFRRVDPVLAGIANKIRPFTIERSKDPFSDLIESIICQQLSEKAGETIFGRFQKLFSGGSISPKKLLSLPDEQIRTVGTSWSKVVYIKNIARAVVFGELNLPKLEKLDDEAVVAELTKIKGIGRWTAEMFLMFTLGREDVFSYGDLGLRKAMKKLYGFKKDPTMKQMGRIVNKWKPYRTWAARILWRSLDLELA